MGSGLIDQVASGEAPPLVPLTVEQLHRMLEKGIIRDGDPIELLEGLLLRKNRAAAGEGEMTHGALHALVLTGQGEYERRTDYRPGQTLLLPLAEGNALPLAVDDAFGPASR